MDIRKDYEEIISWKKQEHNINGWNAMDISCGELLNETETDNIHACVDAMLACMLEGDQMADLADRYSKDFSVRYYCDNLSESRRRIFG